ncbi:TPA: hypothetical protein ACYZYW_004858, partial [Escherichia coli]
SGQHHRQTFEPTMTQLPDSALHSQPRVPDKLLPLCNKINQPSSDHDRSYAPPMTRARKTRQDDMLGSTQKSRQ